MFMIAIDMDNWKEINEEKLKDQKLLNVRLMFNYEKIWHALSAKIMNLRLKLKQQKEFNVELTPPLYSFLIHSPSDYKICQFHPLSAHLKPTFDQLEQVTFSLYNILNSSLYI